MQVIFIIVSLITIGSAIIVVTNRNLFYAALAMMLSFLGVAGLYVLLEAGFIAVSQLLIYIGAISILMIFAIMMTRRLMSTAEARFNSQALWSLVASIFVFVLLTVVIISFWGGVAAVDVAPAVSADTINNMVVDLGKLIVSPDGFVLPFEIISLLLLAALVGSIVIARPEDE
ncbi:MAG: NADH-quinone oxidoreductase subunit J [Anaerolineales bacterium]|nr:NADH-quinone oxidoreductase subunit J [Anaerolineales bacterium]MCB8959264.1 NADH-quinone oxidoreductase subunit J [Ardenticatenales bacterium]MCB0006177.1 NADH-quinone oxidoreductase subunit J [Anaerolineales bacterium]MCB0014016.1 NADH-quinone oxidoreductase subunit J [Anaerolineales bacterium]MCB0016543.1 NADH-quinone oxidoreductase subunit J [Anaerolineales bacterium]